MGNLPKKDRSIEHGDRLKLIPKTIYNKLVINRLC